MTAPTEQPQALPPQALMLQIISGFWVSRGVYVLAKLGIPDLLKDGPKTATELAAATETHGPSLYRVLRALASVGIVDTKDEGKFALNPLSEVLVTGVPGSLRWFAVSELGQEHYPAWGNLMHSVKTGEIAFDNHFGTDIWSYLGQNPDDAAVFNDSMRGMTAAANEAITSLYDFSKFRKVIDVGGGHGGLLTAILKSCPNSKGVLFDAAEVVSGAQSKIEGAGFSSRCETAAGDFFKAVPEGGDAYVMKWIIHDWDDERSIKVLQNCREQIAADGRLILIDCVVPESNEPHFSKFIDMNILVMTGGKERTRKEFSELLEQSGFKLVNIVPTELPFSIIESEPA